MIVTRETAGEHAVMRRALQRCREAVRVEQVLEEIREALIDELGFSRAVVCGLADGIVTPLAWSTAEHLGELAPFALEPQLAEAEIARRRAPVLSEGDHPVLIDTDAWVGAPLTADGAVIGLVLADCALERATPHDRDRLALFAEAASGAVERALLLEQAQASVRAARACAAQLEASFDGPVPPALGPRPAGAAPCPVGALGSRAADHRLAGLLTAREREVAELMSVGARNAQIAARLVISEGTVKSHVKHILRKLHATNRAEAVSKYVRISAA